jgi:hypothetical protein
MKFEVVPDELRDPNGGFEEIAHVLGQNKTLHVTGITNADLSSWYTRLYNRYGRRMRRRLKSASPEDGYIVWLAPADTSDGSPTPTEI